MASHDLPPAFFLLSTCKKWSRGQRSLISKGIVLLFFEYAAPKQLFAGRGGAAAGGARAVRGLYGFWCRGAVSLQELSRYSPKNPENI